MLNFEIKKLSSYLIIFKAFLDDKEKKFNKIREIIERKITRLEMMLEGMLNWHYLTGCSNSSLIK